MKNLTLFTLLILSFSASANKAGGVADILCFGKDCPARIASTLRAMGCGPYASTIHCKADQDVCSVMMANCAEPVDDIETSCQGGAKVALTDPAMSLTWGSPNIRELCIQ